MSTDDRLAAIERKLQYLTDRQEILDCIVRTSRGNDRFDVERISGSYHPNGLHELGWKRISGADYADHANHAHAAIAEVNLHNVTMHSCEIDGDVAHAESYVIGLFLNKDGASSNMFAGRYADRLEKRDGVWRIAVRRSTVEVVMSGDASILDSDAFADRGYLKGMRDRRDVSYQRPLTLEETAGDRW